MPESEYRINLQIIAGTSQTNELFASIARALREIKPLTESVRSDLTAISRVTSRAADSASRLASSYREAADAARAAAREMQTASERALRPSRPAPVAETYRPPALNASPSSGSGGYPSPALAPRVLSWPGGGAPAPGQPGRDWVGAGAAGAGYVYSAEHAVRETLAPAYEQTNALGRATSTLTPAQRGEVLARARAVQTRNPQSSVEGNIEVFSNLLQLSGDYNESLSGLDTLVPAGLALHNQNPNSGSYDTQVMNLGRSAEFLGRLSGRGTGDALNRLGDDVIVGTAMDPRRFDAGKFVSFLMNAGVWGANFDPADIPAVMPLIAGATPGRAGTMQQGFGRQFNEGRMSGNAIDMLQNIGLLRKEDFRHNPNDPAHHIHVNGPGNYRIDQAAWNLSPESEEMRVTHPEAWLGQEVIPRLRDYLSHNVAGWDQMTDRQRSIREVSALGALGSNVPSGAFMASGVTMAAQIARDTARAQTIHAGVTSGAIDITGQLGRLPSAQVESFSASLGHLVGTLGGDAMTRATQSLTALTGTITSLNRALDNHPAATTTASAGATVAATAGGTYATARVAASIADRLRLPGLAARARGVAAAVTSPAALAAGAGYLTHSILSGSGADTTIQNWMDTHIPGAGVVDDAWMRNVSGPVSHFFGGESYDQAKARTAGGGQSGPTGTAQNPLHVHVSNAAELGASAAHGVAVGLTAPPASSPLGVNQGVPLYPGNH